MFLAWYRDKVADRTARFLNAPGGAWGTGIFKLGGEEDEWDKALAVAKLMDDRLYHNTITLRCDTCDKSNRCRAGSNAYATWAGPGTKRSLEKVSMTFCFKYWKKGDTDWTLTHELTHALGGTTDKLGEYPSVYWHNGDKPQYAIHVGPGYLGIGEAPEGADFSDYLQNADTWTRFLMKFDPRKADGR